MALVLAYSAFDLKEIMNEEMMGSSATKDAKISAKYSRNLMMPRLTRAVVLEAVTEVVLLAIISASLPYHSAFALFDLAEKVLSESFIAKRKNRRWPAVNSRISTISTMAMAQA